ncbi:MAG: AAA family ATPase [Candidatus Absconditicoccaceae bacterium]
MESVVMTVGKTHSGKTTFGKELAINLKKTCVLDSDVLAEFLKTTYPSLYNVDYNRDSNELTQGYYLKLSLMIDIFKRALKTDVTIISTAANSNKGIRRRARILTHRAGRKLIMVYFNRPEKVLLNRIASSSRSKLCLTHSKDFKDLLLNRQSKVFEIPDSKEADVFFEINDDKSWKDVQLKILKLTQE